jgi:GTP cyclohydrolase III
VAYYLERWPGGPDPREQQDLQTLQRLLYAALLECTLHEDGQR